jgi:hypothetical protein
VPTDPPAWALILAGVIIFALAVALPWILAHRERHIVLRCVTCPAECALPFDEIVGVASLEAARDWAFEAEMGWRCPKCAGHPPTDWKELYGHIPHDFY